MDFLVSSGINWIIAIQSLGTWLEIPMKFFSFLGSENFLFLILPLVYWSIDSRLGLQIAMILAASNNLKPILKMFFAGPRPYWVSAKVKAFVYESSFGIPSGHAQDAVALWGITASYIRKRWAWIVAIALAFFIGFSRLYLAAHFVHDVLAGWFVGAVLLWVFTRFWDSAIAWLKTKSLSQQIWIAFVISLISIALAAGIVVRLDGYTFPKEWKDNALRTGPIPAPVSMEDPLTAAGTFFGLAVGAAWLATRGGYQASGPIEKRALRYVIGLIGVAILWRGLGLVFPNQADLVSYILRYIRYSLAGFWVTAGAPWLFFRFKLAETSNM
jgi:membrane-associated phospholipid phosphatase